MTPSQVRLVFGLFVVFGAGVAANAMLLQSGPSITAAGRIAAEKAAQKAAVERLKRLQAEAVLPPPATEAPKTIARAGVKPDALPQPPAAEPERKQPAVDERPQRIAIAPPQAAIRLARLKPDAANADAIPETPDAEGSAETIRAVQRELQHLGYGPLTVDGVPGLLTRAAIMAFEHDNRMALTGEATETLLKRLLLGQSGEKQPAGEAGRIRSQQAEIVLRTVQQSLAALGYQPGKIDGRVGDETERAIREFEMDHGLDPTGRVSAELFSRLAKAVSNTKVGAATPAERKQ